MHAFCLEQLWLESSVPIRPRPRRPSIASALLLPIYAKRPSNTETAVASTLLLQRIGDDSGRLQRQHAAVEEGIERAATIVYGVVVYHFVWLQ